MTLIVQHSQGNVPLVNAAGVVRRSRIFCNKDWVIPTMVRINPATGFQSIPIWPMPNGRGLLTTSLIFEYTDNKCLSKNPRDNYFTTISKQIFTYPLLPTS